MYCYSVNLHNVLLYIFWQIVILAHNRACLSDLCIRVPESLSSFLSGQSFSFIPSQSKFLAASQRLLAVTSNYTENGKQLLAFRVEFEIQINRKLSCFCSVETVEV